MVPYTLLLLLFIYFNLKWLFMGGCGTAKRHNTQVTHHQNDAPPSDKKQHAKLHSNKGLTANTINKYYNKEIKPVIHGTVTVMEYVLSSMMFLVRPVMNVLKMAVTKQNSSVLYC
jgi:hypothetical protein